MMAFGLALLLLGRIRGSRADEGAIGKESRKVPSVSDVYTTSYRKRV